MMVPSSCSSEGWPITASWTLGSKGWPSEATGRRPSSASTSASCSRVACTPSRMSPPASRARSRLSRTGSSSCTSLSDAIEYVRMRSRSWRLREFSNSAFRRRRASRYWSRSLRVASSSSESASKPSTSRPDSPAAGTGSSSASTGAPESSASLSGGAGSSWELWGSTASTSGATSSPNSGSRLFSSLLKASWSSCGYRAGGRGGSVSHPRSSGLALPLLALLVVLVFVDDLGVLDQVVRVCSLGGLLLLLCLAVEDFGELVGGSHQGLLLALDLLDVAAGERLLRLLYGLLDLELRVRVDLAVNVLQRTLDGVDQIVRVVADI